MKDINSDSMHLNELPGEIIPLILSYFTPIELLTLQNVCTKWFDIISNDKSLWNHLVLSTEDLDVKTSMDLIRQMPLLKAVYMGNINSANDMAQLINVLCESCWELKQIKFLENCNVHPSARDLYQLSCYHPKLKKIQLSTKSKITADEVFNIGCVLHDFQVLEEITFCGLQWYINCNIVGNILSKMENLHSLGLPSIPGLKAPELRILASALPQLVELHLNITSLSCKTFTFAIFKKLKILEIIDSSQLSTQKMKMLQDLSIIKKIELTLSKCSKKEVILFFKAPWTQSVKSLVIKNCSFSDELLEVIALKCINLIQIFWLNLTDFLLGEITDLGLKKITSNMKQIRYLEIKSRSITKLYYEELSNLKNIQYVRINGMKISGCP